MEFINKIELQGVVGNAKVDTIGETKSVRFSLCTQNAYNSEGEDAVVDCTWFNCLAWEGKKTKDITKIKSYDMIHLKGRVRTYSYIGADGADKYTWEVLCYELEILPKQD